MVVDHESDIFEDGLVVEDEDFDDDVTFAGAVFRGRDVRFTESEFRASGDVSFENATFENDGDVSFEKVDFENGDDVLFTDVTFANTGDVVFDDADFLNPGGVYFTDVAFENDGVVRFQDAVFAEDVYFDPEVIESSVISFKDTRFESGTLYVDSFADVDLEGVTFVDTNLRGADFVGANLEWATFIRSDLRGANLSDARLHGVVFDDPAIDDTTNFGVVSPSDGNATKYISYDYRSDYETDLEKAERTYGILENLGADENLIDLQIESYLRRKRMTRHRHWERISMSSAGTRHALRYSYSLASRVLTKHGEDPWRVLGAFAGLIVFSSVVYYLAGAGGATTITESVYYSVLAAVGSVQFTSTDGIRLLVGFEAVLGSTLLALLVFVLGRRTTR